MEKSQQGSVERPSILDSTSFLGDPSTSWHSIARKTVPGISCSLDARYHMQNKIYLNLRVFVVLEFWTYTLQETHNVVFVPWTLTP